MLARKVLKHLEKYWQLAQRCYNESEYPLAAFLAITLIEEVGKVVIIGNARLGTQLDRRGFYRHNEKYTYAVFTTLFVNSRVTRVYGKEEKKFAMWFREGELFKIRNRALYMELDGRGVLVPQEVISQEDAFLLVCISGEILAEIQSAHYTGTGPNDWQRLLDEVEGFRLRHKSNNQDPINELMGNGGG